MSTKKQAWKYNTLLTVGKNYGPKNIFETGKEMEVSLPQNEGSAMTWGYSNPNASVPSYNGAYSTAEGVSVNPNIGSSNFPIVTMSPEQAQANAAQAISVPNPINTPAPQAAPSGDSGGGKGGLFSDMKVTSAGLGGAASALGGIAGSAIAGDFKGTTQASGIMDGVGDAVSGLGPWGALAGFAIKGLSGLVDRTFGAAMNEAGTAKANAGIAAANNFQANAAGTNDFAALAASAGDATNFSQADIGKDGWLSTKARDKFEDMQKEAAVAAARQNRALSNNAQNIAVNKAANAMRNMAEFGGNIFALGGGMDSINKWLKEASGTGLNPINAGGSHKSNPEGGVQMGVDHNGVPNYVEEGETVFNDYVFSKKLKISDRLIKKYPKLFKPGMSYAEGSIKASEEAELLGGNDEYANSTQEAILADLAQDQDEQNRKREQAEAEAQQKQMMEYLQNNPELLAQLQQEQAGLEQVSMMPGVEDMAEAQPDAIYAALGGHLGHVYKTGTRGLRRRKVATSPIGSLDIINPLSLYGNEPLILGLENSDMDTRATEAWARQNDANVAMGIPRDVSIKPDYSADEIKARIDNMRPIVRSELTPAELTPAYDWGDIMDYNAGTLTYDPEATDIYGLPIGSASDKVKARMDNIRPIVRSELTPAPLPVPSFDALAAMREVVGSRPVKGNPLNSFDKQTGLRRKQELKEATLEDKAAKQATRKEKWQKFAGNIRDRYESGEYNPAVLMSLGEAVKQSFRKPDYSIADNIPVSTAYQSVGFNPVGTKATYKPMDVNMMENSIIAQGNASLDALVRNGGGNPNSIANQILAQNFNTANARGQARTQAEMQNFQQQMAVLDANNKIDQFNAQGMLDASKTNAMLFAQAQEQNNRNAIWRARIKQDIKNQFEEDQAQSWENFGNNWQGVADTNKNLHSLEVLGSRGAFGNGGMDVLAELHPYRYRRKKTQATV